MNRATYVALIVLAACASGPAADQAEWPNPPRCIAAETDATVPPDAVDSPPRPRAITLPAPPDGLNLRERIDLEMIVTADGRVDPASVRTPGHDDRRVRDWAVVLVETWRFQPARRDGCWVASPYRWSMRVGD